jgi:fatty-acyl-CoA synthase
VTSSPDRADPRFRRAVNLAELLTQTARRLPNADAVVTASQRITWRELDARVGALADELRQRGVGRGDVALVHSPNHVELIQSMFAAWRVGAVFAPTNCRLTPAEVAVLAALCRPSVLLCDTGSQGHAQSVRGAADLTAGVLWIGADGADSVSAVTASRAGATVPNATVEVGDPAWYFFTSGTSGRPKAAVLTHDQMGFVVTNHLCDLMPGTTSQDAQIVVAPLSHGAGVHLLANVAAGAKTVLTSSPTLDSAEVWRLVEDERVTNMFTVPTILKLLAESPTLAEHDLSGLRYVVYAGAPMYRVDQERAREALGDVLVQYYGLAEVTGNITVLPPNEHGRAQPDGLEFGTCGYARTGMQISIQDDDGNELPAGSQGEICVAGPAVFAGYLDNPKANADAFRRGWFRTGDLGQLDDHGYLYVTGRASDMFISGGSNIYPREIEEKLLQHPAIAEVAVLGVPDPLWGEAGVAVCVPGPGQSVDEHDVRAWLEPRLARYKVPKRVVVWDRLPKSAYGKIVKRTIREQLEAQDAQPRPVAEVG